jgi:hydrogenase/urease accessory protein HupE
VGLSSGEYKAQGKELRVHVAFARDELLTLAPGIDENHDRVLVPAELSSARGALQGLVNKVRVTGDAQACKGALQDAALTEQDGVLLNFVYACDAQPARFEVELGFLADVAAGHRHLARIAGADTRDQIMTRGEHRFQVAPAAGPAPAAKSASPGFLGFIKLGVEHILTGYDHLVFLLGMVLVRGRLRSVLGVVTAFTIAHSITLALSTLDVWAPRPSLVEPAIALSIAYVGIENFFVRSIRGRWRVTFPFGLIHGFGFAGALKEIDLPRAQIPTALVSFNLGVELGQLAVLALLLPLIALARNKAPWFETKGAKVMSGAIVLAGVVWFVLRVAGYAV